MQTSNNYHACDDKDGYRMPWETRGRTEEETPSGTLDRGWLTWIVEVWKSERGTVSCVRSEPLAGHLRNWKLTKLIFSLQIDVNMFSESKEYKKSYLSHNTELGPAIGGTCIQDEKGRGNQKQKMHFVLLFKFHMKKMSYGICLLLSDLVHLAQCCPGPSIFSWNLFYCWVIFHCIYIH